LLPPADAPQQGALLVRQRLALRLVHLVERLAEDYSAYAVGQAPDDTKAFAAHHAACKAAVAHLTLLMRLAHSIAPEQTDELAPHALISQARLALSQSGADLELTAEHQDAILRLTAELGDDTIDAEM
jgi:hypothetical protein